MRLDVLEEFAEAAKLSKWGFDFGELPARWGFAFRELPARKDDGRSRQIRYWERWRPLLLARARSRYTPEWRRAKYLRLRAAEVERSRAYGRAYHENHKNDPGYRERARANAKAYYYANREAINAKRSRRAMHKISPDSKEKP